MLTKLRLFHKKQKGMSLVELILVIGVCGLLVLGGSLATIQIIRSNQASLASAGVIRDVMKEIKAGITQAPPDRVEPLTSSPSSIYDYAIIALNGNVSFTGNVTIKSDPQTPYEGDVYSSGNINLTGNVNVYGDGIAAGTIGKTGNVKFWGTEVQNLNPPLVFAAVDTSALLAQANAGPQPNPIPSQNLSGNGTTTLGPVRIAGDLTVSGNRVIQLGGTVWVDGTISMTGNTRIQGPGTIVAVGNIGITVNSQLQPDDIPLIVSTTGNITVTGNSTTSAILYAPNDYIRLTGNGTLYGSIVGKSINNTGNPRVTYPVSLRGRD